MEWGIRKICNIVDNIENIDNNNNIIYKFFSDNNNEGLYNKDLCILTNSNNSHYDLLFDKIYKCFKRYKLDLIILNSKSILLFNQPNKSEIKIINFLKKI